MTTSEKVKALGNGGRVVLSESNGLRVVAEKSGDGKIVRIVRESARGFEVIKTYAE